MLAEQGEAPFTDPRWLYEPKLDGYRILAFIQWHASPTVLAAGPGFDSPVSQRGRGTVPAVGEHDADRRRDHRVRRERQTLRSTRCQNRAQLKTEREIAQAERKSPCMLYVFDILHFAGINLRGAPYMSRGAAISRSVCLPGRTCRSCMPTRTGEALYPAALAAGSKA
jgi:bifunctional non-homologous end joining protein LigD